MQNKRAALRKLGIDSVVAPKWLQRDMNPSDSSIIELAKSIEANGLIEPIVVREKEGRFHLVVGWRRVMAHMHLQKAEIEAKVVTMTDAEYLEVRWAENEDRVDVSPLEQAKHLKEMMIAFDCNQEDLAKKIRKSEAYVSQRLQLLTTYSIIRDALVNEQINFAQARELMQFKTEADVKEYMHYAIESGATAALLKQWRKTMEARKELGIVEGGIQETVENTQPQVQTFVCECCREGDYFQNIKIIRVCPGCEQEIKTAHIRAKEAQEAKSG